MIPFSLSFTESQHQALQQHLFPGDGKEAVAILLCARREGERRHRLLVRDLHIVPYSMCTARTPARVTWPTELIEPWLEKAVKDRLSVMKIHSHPGGLRRFSETDDDADRELLPMVRGWVEHDIPHGSAVMLPTGEVFGRVYAPQAGFTPLRLVNVVGSDLHFWYVDGSSNVDLPPFVASHAQAFGEGTTERFRRLTFAVLGASGTGSPTIEQLVRLGAGEIILVDDDTVEDRNVNRIINSTMEDARKRKSKVDVLGDAIEHMELGTRIIRIKKNLWDPDVIRAVAEADVVFGCMDSIDGRYLLNLLTTYYILPYFDIGVRLDAIGTGAERGKIREICGTVNYLQPGLSSLMSRGLFSMKDVADAGLRRRDPSAFDQQINDGYIRGVSVSRPAVISVNMYAASLAVNDLLARLHPYREESNREVASIEFSLKSLEMFTDPEGAPCLILRDCVGRGDVLPLLDTSELFEKNY